MSERTILDLPLLSTGVPGLDQVLGGGLPEYSFNLIAGVPGAGKTTLIHQLLFANATLERPALYFTIVGEPALKMLRYQQQLAFFDAEKIGTAIRFVDLSAEVLAGDLDGVLERILQEVTERAPALVVIDSFRSLVPTQPMGRDRNDVQSFLQRLAIHAASWQVTSFLIGEYGPDELVNNPVMTITDSILVMSQSKERSSVVRKLEVMKMRGMASVPGLHTFRITQQGVEVFPRTTSWMHGRELTREGARMRFGIPEFDAMLGGGVPPGDVTLIAGPSGTGKTVLCTSFVAEGLRENEPAVLALFEEHPDEYVARAASLGFDLAPAVQAGQLRLLHIRPLDLSADEIVCEIQRAVTEIGARRLVIDSLNGLELALASTFRDEFRESLYRMASSLTRGSVSVVMTIEVAEAFDELKFSPHAISFLAQNIVLLRYVEIAGALRRMVAIIKMRRSGHSRELREYEISGAGFQMVGTLQAYSGILTGTPSPERRGSTGLGDQEAMVLGMVVALVEPTLEQLAGTSGLGTDALATILHRLEQTGHVRGRDVAGARVFRANEQRIPSVIT